MSKKSKNPIPKHSKEFQIKMRPEIATSDEASIQALMEVLREIEASRRYGFRIVEKKARRWERHGERYDTQRTDGLFKVNNISLATEKRGNDKHAKTKLKCKLHNFVPELLYRKPEKSFCYPGFGAYRDDPEVEIKLKLEQDIHFDNCKYAATGYLTIPGREYQFCKVADFLRYYKRLKRIQGIDTDTALVRVKDWQESIYDDLEFYIDDWKFKGALVTRRETKTGCWDETEFSFKIEQPKAKCKWLDPAAGWPYGKLRTLAAIYNEMFQKKDVFIQSPSIFYFSNPVSSQKIKVDLEDDDCA